jgi:Dockerin type I domain
MNENGQQQPEQEFDAPPKLAAALKDVSYPELFVPPYIDAAVLKAARQHLVKPAKPRRFRPWVLWPALAAGCVLIVCAARLLTTSGQSHYAREDLNHDGKVDILDSFALARELKSGKHLPATYDVNGDGVIDERDVLLIATHAVKLNKDNGS